MSVHAATEAQLNNSSITSRKTNDVDQLRKPKKKTRRRSSSSLAAFFDHPIEDPPAIAFPYHRSSSLSLSAEFAEVSLKHSFDQQWSLPMKSPLGFTPSQKAKYPRDEETSLANFKTQRNGRAVPWQWLKIRKGMKTKKSITSRGGTSVDGASKVSVSKGKLLQDRELSSEEEEEDLLRETDLVNQNIAGFGFNSPCLKNQYCRHQCENKGSNKSHSHTSLSNRYQPKLFEDIAGHEIVVKALSNAVQKEKIAPLYLFHGPGGTGKTSTARILAMALNCESSTQTKPCWSCRGCTHSLYSMDICSGSRTTGFERIKTLMQNTTFTQIANGFKVFIIEECHLLTGEAWEEILTMVERSSDSSVVFVMVTDDVNKVPKNVSSRCQKFCFPKLKDMDITLKLARIVAREHIGIERDALKLIITKADGSMREAENILDQLALLGSRITSPVVQQIVGLVPHNKLLDLLTTILSADTIQTVRSKRELIASGVPAQSVLSQLASLVTDILSGASAIDTSSPGSSKEKRLSRTGSQLTDDQSERLSHALKMLVETEKQLVSSNDHTNWLVASLLQIASEQVSNKTSSGSVLTTDIVVPSPDSKFDSESRTHSININKTGLAYLLQHSRSRKYHKSFDRIIEQSDIQANDPSPSTRSTSNMKQSTMGTIEAQPNLRQLGDMEEMWQNILGRIQSGYVKEFLSRQGRLASLTISNTNAIVHLLFKRPDDKLAAQMSEETIAKALEMSMGCPVTVNMSLDPVPSESVEGSNVLKSKLKVPEFGNSRQEQSSTQFMRASESPGSSKAVVPMRRSKSQKSPMVSEKLKLLRLQESEAHMSHKRSSGGPEGSKTRTQQIPPFSGPLTQGNKGGASAEHANSPSVRDDSPGQTTNVAKTTNSKHRWLSLSSIPQADASVERYSQDLLFERENSERGGKRSTSHRACLSKDNEDQHCQHSGTLVRFTRSWSCSEIFCRHI